MPCSRWATAGTRKDTYSSGTSGPAVPTCQQRSSGCCWSEQCDNFTKWWLDSDPGLAQEATEASLLLLSPHPTHALLLWRGTNLNVDYRNRKIVMLQGLSWIFVSQLSIRVMQGFLMRWWGRQDEKAVYGHGWALWEYIFSLWDKCYAVWYLWSSWSLNSLLEITAW